MKQRMHSDGYFFCRLIPAMDDGAGSQSNNDVISGLQISDDESISPSEARRMQRDNHKLLKRLVDGQTKTNDLLAEIARELKRRK